MNQIKDLRSEVEKLHQKLFQFLMQRQDLVQQIWQIKQAQKVELTDPQRELELIHQFDQTPELQQDKALREFYQNVVKSIITENKKYLKATK